MDKGSGKEQQGTHNKSWLKPLFQGLQYNQAKERSESGNMDKGNGLRYNQAKERSESGNMDKGNGLQYNQAKERSESGNMDKGR
ncbi:hypothetical protein HPP92_008255 [Vanilla planifolia]|nr:hypothetical protein HPP92_008255 [Vanilla planifolia]